MSPFVGLPPSAALRPQRRSANLSFAEGASLLATEAKPPSRPPRSLQLDASFGAVAAPALPVAQSSNTRSG